MPKFDFILTSMWIAKISSVRQDWRCIIRLYGQRFVPTEPMSLSYPGALEQQPSYKGDEVRFSNTLKKVSPNCFCLRVL